MLCDGAVQASCNGETPAEKWSYWEKNGHKVPFTAALPLSGCPTARLGWAWGLIEGQAAKDSEWIISPSSQTVGRYATG